jgi:hypothetical protein
MACGEPEGRRGVQRSKAGGAVSEDVFGVRAGLGGGSSALGSVPGVSDAAFAGAEAVIPTD